MKENGRVAPADVKEFAAVRYKTMYCPKCNKKFDMKKVIFGSSKCTVCSTLLVDNDCASNKFIGD